MSGQSRVHPPLFPALLAEGLGTALLLAVVVGSGIMAEGLSAGNAGVALLGNTAATAAALVVLIGVFGPLSGAQFNPAVTLALAVTGRFPPGRVAAYVAVQVVAAVLGVWLAHAMFDQPLMQISDNARPGAGRILAEAVATSLLLLTILVSLRRGENAAIAARVALVVTAGYWFTASTCFANPAVTLARALSDSFAGIAPGDVPGFLLGQGLGVALALLIDRALHRP